MGLVGHRRRDKKAGTVLGDKMGGNPHEHLGSWGSMDHSMVVGVGVSDDAFGILPMLEICEVHLRMVEEGMAVLYRQGVLAPA